MRKRCRGILSKIERINFTGQSKFLISDRYKGENKQSTIRAENSVLFEQSLKMVTDQNYSKLLLENFYACYFQFHWAPDRIDNYHDEH